jgi:hypothetical protein
MELDERVQCQHCGRAVVPRLWLTDGDFLTYKVVLQKIFWPQLIVAKSLSLPQYLVWTEIFCNIYEAGTGVKQYSRRTSPVAARASVFATRSVDPLRIRPHLGSCCRSPSSDQRAGPRSIIYPGIIAHEVRSALSPKEEAGRPITNPRHQEPMLQARQAVLRHLG